MSVVQQMRRRPLVTYTGATKRALAEDVERDDKRRRLESHAARPACRTGTLEGWIRRSTPVLSSDDTSVFSDAQTPGTSPPSSPPPVAALDQPVRVFAPKSCNATTKLVQMQISLGSEQQKTCRECGMTFVKSNAEDVALHNKYHSRYLYGVDLGKAFRNAVDGRASKQGRNGGIIVVVDADDRSFERNKAQEVLGLVQTELGAVDIRAEDLWAKNSAVPGDVPAGRDHPSACHYRFFLYLIGTRCVGLCLARTISQAFEVTEQLDEHDSEAMRTPDAIHISAIPRQASVGISRIWTLKSHRGQGLAVALLDAVLQTFEIGRVFSKDEVAFSQPTTCGLQLARKWYRKPCGWLVYID